LEPNDGHPAILPEFCKQTTSVLLSRWHFVTKWLRVWLQNATKSVGRPSFDYFCLPNKAKGYATGYAGACFLLVALAIGIKRPKIYASHIFLTTKWR
jgi:hypothetical protein